MEAIEFLRKKYSISGDKTIQEEIGDPAFNWTLICKLLDEYLQANRHEVLVNEQRSGLANGAVADIGKTFIINTDEGKLALSQEDILNTIDADLDMMDNGDLMTWEVMRKDMTEKEINNLPEQR